MKRDARRLGRILRVRRVQEEVARAEWLRAELVARKAEDSADALAAALRAATTELVQPGARRTPAWLILQERVLDAMAQRVRVARAEAAEARGKAQAAHAPWQARRRDALGIERLYDRARLAALRAAEAKATAELDEVALRRAAARRAEKSEPR